MQMQLVLLQCNTE